VSVTTPVSPPRSITSKARRSQIIAATVEVIAEVGYAQASFARIAERAGLSSTRLISYHFAGKDDLMSAVAEDVISSIGAYMTSRLANVQGSPARLAAYIEGVVEFIASNRSAMKALTDIFLAGALNYDAERDETVVSPLEAILREGQAEGDFRDFDPRVIAVVVQRAVDGLPFLLQSRPDLDCAAYARELVTLFDLATRARPS
jgi:AcrR family transcriptional regulator